MDEHLEDKNESMKAMQRRMDEVWEDDSVRGARFGGNAATQDADKDRLNPAAMAGAAGGTAGLGTDKNSGGEIGLPTGEGYNGHVGGTGTEATDGNT
ncbi:hypothetical protein [Adhaeribacter aquaticus]|uniref:hypothetical protein n=1 Tax=Adhaeribacter aquaticus TaxID=299567 RepID=UPI00040B8D9A|nr:hypothetical protein [Adhaeribacter aquaticus]